MRMASVGGDLRASSDRRPGHVSVRTDVVIVTPIAQPKEVREMSTGAWASQSGYSTEPCFGGSEPKIPRFEIKQLVVSNRRAHSMYMHYCRRDSGL